MALSPRIWLLAYVSIMCSPLLGLFKTKKTWGLPTCMEGLCKVVKGTSCQYSHTFPRNCLIFTTLPPYTSMTFWFLCSLRPDTVTTNFSAKSMGTSRHFSMTKAEGFLQLNITESPYLSGWEQFRFQQILQSSKETQWSKSQTLLKIVCKNGIEWDTFASPTRDRKTG